MTGDHSPSDLTVGLPRTIPHRELRNNSGAVFREARAGETVYITNNDEMPPSRAPGASLRIRWATVHGGFAELKLTQLGEPVQNVLEELRSDR